jgi:DNA-binding winged helix-turn-helix (wHTH) protein
MTSHVLQVGDLMFDPQRMLVERAGLPIKLPPKCLRILEVLAQHPHKVFSRKELETAVWGEEQTNSDSLRSHIYILRRALAQPGQPALVETVHGMGFRLVPADAH